MTTTEPTTDDDTPPTAREVIDDFDAFVNGIGLAATLTLTRGVLPKPVDVTDIDQILVDGEWLEVGRCHIHNLNLVDGHASPVPVGTFLVFEVYARYDPTTAAEGERPDDDATAPRWPDPYATTMLPLADIKGYRWVDWDRLLDAEKKVVP